MNATGVIVEYNPFHNGHLYHINLTKQKTGADVVIAVMSGHFLQRGEPALVDKWQRATMALQAGVDLVIELPYCFATGHAKDFAFGGVSLLESLGCQTMSFGSEAGSIEGFKSSYSLLNAHNDEVQLNIHEQIKSGISYPQALNNSYKVLSAKYNLDLIDLSQPNNILGYHYVEQIMTHHFAMQPLTIQRITAGYHDDVSKNESIASATGIRKELLQQKQLSAIEQFIPPTSLESLITNDSYSSWETFYPQLRFTILRSSPAELRQYVDLTEGIEFLIYKAAQQCNTFPLFMQKIKSKRYTWTRIQRMLCHIFVGYTKEQRENFTSPRYIRILGMTSIGQQYISIHKKDFKLPIVSRVASFKDSMLEVDIRATDLYMLASGHHIIGKDYKTPPIRLLNK
ncbi:nucleotidyltransferase [Kurthia sibirica]|uniref:tRNA(Met) cytidine acetate ligase n=1 Tax=Kurthia sibirica TaxID=202750 RepID=A0A2U3AQN0_9BACL|nr:nucleotidyltransferase [Kurthia sibirica]PWI26806.1 nucleotidyltransferase [Kurthia sibirica]GEK32657.1 UPF0348 protein YlbM [Kurthia sibirica]